MMLENTLKDQMEIYLTKLKITISPEDNVEIRNLSFKNYGEENETLEIHSILEPVLSTRTSKIMHIQHLIVYAEYKNQVLAITKYERMKTKKKNILLEFHYNAIANFR